MDTGSYSGDGCFAGVFLLYVLRRLYCPEWGAIVAHFRFHSKCELAYVFDLSASPKPVQIESKFSFAPVHCPKEELEVQ